MPDHGTSSPPASITASPDALFDGLDLALMHRYSTVTCSRLMPSESLRLWQVTLPAVAETYDIIQRGMLALAAFDLAAADDTSTAQIAKYRSRGLHHQQMALPIFRQCLERDEPRDRNAVFMFSILLLFLSFASAHSAPSRPTLDEILDLFALFQGVRTLWGQHSDGANKHLIQDMFPTLLPFELRQENFQPQNFPDPLLDRLAVDDVTAGAVWHLRRAQCIEKECHDLRSVVWFPALGGAAFYEQVRQHRPAALRITSRYASILESFRQWWWVGSWGAMLESAIQDVVREESIVLPA